MKETQQKNNITGSNNPENYNQSAQSATVKPIPIKLPRPSKRFMVNVGIILAIGTIGYGLYQSKLWNKPLKSVVTGDISRNDVSLLLDRIHALESKVERFKNSYNHSIINIKKRFERVNVRITEVNQFDELDYIPDGYATYNLLLPVNGGSGRRHSRRANSIPRTNMQ